MTLRAAALVFGAAVVVAGTGLGAQTHADHAAHMAQMAAPAHAAVRVMTPQPAVGDIGLVDQDGRQTSLREAIGNDKPTLVEFIFTTCTTICPVMTSGMSQFLTNLGASSDRVRVISVSIDPELDTVEAMRDYAARYHAPRSWRFLTGSKASVEAAQRVFNNYRGGKNNHAPGTFIRSSPTAPWIAIDGFASAEMLLHGYLGHLMPGRS